MHNLEEAGEAAPDGSISSGGGADGFEKHNADLLAIAGSESEDIHFTESVCSSDNDNDLAGFHAGNDDVLVVEKREVLAPTPSILASAPPKEEEEQRINTTTQDLIRRSQRERERQRQKLEKRRSSASEDIEIGSAAVRENERLNAPLAAKREAPQSYGQQDGPSNLEEQPISPLIGTPAVSLAVPAADNYSDYVEELGDEDPLSQTSESDMSAAPFIPPDSFHGANNEENDRRNSLNPQMSLDLRAIFNSRRSISTDGKATQGGYHESLSAFSTFSHNVMVSVFAPDGDEVCCRGRRGYIVFVFLIVVSVILFAEFLDTDGGSSSTSGLEILVPPTEPPSQMPSIAPKGAPSLIPSMTTTTLVPSTAPTLAPSLIPSVLPSKFVAAPSLSPSFLPTSSVVIPTTSSAASPAGPLTSIPSSLAPGIPLATTPQPAWAMPPQERWPRRQRHHHEPDSQSYLR